MHRLRLLGIDLGLLLIASVAALWLRDNLQLSPDRVVELVPYFGYSLVAAAIVFPIAGTNRGLWRYSGLRTYLDIAAANVVVVLLAVGVSFSVDRLEGVARSLPILQGMLAVALMTSVRVGMRLRQQAKVATATTPVAPLAAKDTVLIAGVTHLAELFIRAAHEQRPGEIVIAGLLGRNDRQSGRLFQEYPVLGLVEDAPAVIRDLAVHGVFVTRIVLAADVRTLPPAAREALLEVERSSNIKLDNFADRILPPTPANEGRWPWPKDDVDHGRSLSLERLLEEQPLAKPYWAWKRVFDIVLATTLLVVLSPLIALVAFLVLLDVGRPILFWQQRPGRFGRPFRVFKFRTMRSAHDDAGNYIPDGERSSPIGRFLRRSRFDEFPQLWNILLGHMSFVGPRPLLPVDQNPAHTARLAVAPGLTGWAQVNGGREISAEDKSALDIWYIKNASFSLDAKIALMTLAMVLFGEKTNQDAIQAAWRAIQHPNTSGELQSAA
jgi:lipopolysaccharide/colanic/teichoic acid biosynthesis glycosyltransferase